MSGSSHPPAIQDHHVSSTFPTTSHVVAVRCNTSMSKQPASTVVGASSCSGKPSGKSVPLKRAFSDGSLAVPLAKAKRASASDNESLVSIREAEYPDHGFIATKQLSEYPVYAKQEYTQHDCSNACPLGESQQALNAYIRTSHSPLLLPLLFGWYRQVKTTGKGKKNLKKVVTYFTPCGKQLDCIKDVYDYLMLVGSIVPITVFT